MTLNGAMAVILRYYTEFVISETPTSNWLQLDPPCLRQKSSLKNLVFSNIMAIFAEVTENECINERH